LKLTPDSREKSCASYGKSINREKIEAEFETLLNELTPSRELFTISAIMFKRLWDKQTRALTHNTPRP